MNGKILFNTPWNVSLALISLALSVLKLSLNKYNHKNSTINVKITYNNVITNTCWYSKVWNLTIINATNTNIAYVYPILIKSFTTNLLNIELESDDGGLGDGLGDGLGGGGGGGGGGDGGGGVEFVGGDGLFWPSIKTIYIIIIYKKIYYKL